MLNQKEICNLEYVSCPRCGSKENRLVVSGLDRLHKIPGEYYAVECCNCYFWFQNPRPVASHLPNLYPSEYLPHQKPTSSKIGYGKLKYLNHKLKYKIDESEAETKNKTGWHQLKIFDFIRGWLIGVELIPSFVPGGKLLEIGCASGGRLLSLRSLGWEHLYGIELVKEAAQRANAEGFNIVNGQVEDTLNQYPDAYFDVIISSMVIEHLYNPFQMTHLIASKLIPGGQFLFSTVVRDGLDAKIFRDYWSGFDFPRHMVYFKKNDLLGMLKNQFENIHLFHQNAPIDFVRPAISRKEEGKGSIKDSLILALARSPFSYMFGLILAWMKLTCRVSIHCKKRK